MLRKRILALVGMPGCGKALASEVARSMGLPVLAFGDVIRDEVLRRGLRATMSNVGDMMFRIRKEEGEAVVANRLIPKIEAARSTVVVVEGPRNWEEIEELKRRYDIWIVAIHSSPSTRLRRLMKRRRSDDPMGLRDFLARDEREFKVGVGKVIALADTMIVNEGSQKELKTTVAKMINERYGSPRSAAAEVFIDPYDPALRKRQSRAFEPRNLNAKCAPPGNRS